MTHMIEKLNDGTYSHAYAGETPWHGLGKRVSNDLTPIQMQEAAGLNWKVKKTPLFAHLDEQYVYAGSDALVRESDNKILDIVGKDWNPCQNDEAFQFFNDFVMAGNMEMHTAGSLRGGRMVWALAKIKDSFELFGEDRVEPYLLFSNPHLFGKSITIQLTPVRVVCNNTLTLSLSSKVDKMVSVNHRSKFDQDEAKQAIGIAEQLLEKYKNTAKFLSSKQYKVEDMIRYFNTLFPNNNVEKIESRSDLSRNAKKAYDIVETQPGAEYAPGSFWNLYNSMTYLTNHELGRNADNRLHSTWFGVNRDKNIKALNLAVEMANNV